MRLLIQPKRFFLIDPLTLSIHPLPSFSPVQGFVDPAGHPIFRSGDGTVPFESMAFARFWKGSIPHLKFTELSNRLHSHLPCDVELFKIVRPSINMRYDARVSFIKLVSYAIEDLKEESKDLRNGNIDFTF